MGHGLGRPGGDRVTTERLPLDFACSNATFRPSSGINSVVECQLPKTGNSPVVTAFVAR